MDGTKLRANANWHKTMSYKRMVEREAQLEAEFDAMLAEAVDGGRSSGPDARLASRLSLRSQALF